MTVAYFPAVTWSDRRHDWTVVHLHTDVVAAGSYVLAGNTRQGPNGTTLPVAVYRPGRDGTHTPLGPHELEDVGLRERPAGTEPPP